MKTFKELLNEAYNWGTVNRHFGPELTRTQEYIDFKDIPEHVRKHMENFQSIKEEMSDDELVAALSGEELKIPTIDQGHYAVGTKVSTPEGTGTIIHSLNHLVQVKHDHNNSVHVLHHNEVNPIVTEEVAVNNVGSGAIAGAGVGEKGEPGVKKKKDTYLVTDLLRRALIGQR